MNKLKREKNASSWTLGLGARALIDRIAMKFVDSPCERDKQLHGERETEKRSNLGKLSQLCENLLDRE